MNEFEQKPVKIDEIENGNESKQPQILKNIDKENKELK